MNNKNTEDNNTKNLDHHDELLHIMKMRIIDSYKWKVDIIEPFSEELGVTPEELKEILIKRLDMSSLEALQPRYESSKHYCIKEKVHSDLRLCWLCDVMNIITKDEAEKIKNQIANEILVNGKTYPEAIKDGKKNLLEYLKR